MTAKIWAARLLPAVGLARGATLVGGACSSKPEESLAPARARQPSLTRDSRISRTAAARTVRAVAGSGRLPHSFQAWMTSAAWTRSSGDRSSAGHQQQTERAAFPGLRR